MAVSPYFDHVGHQGQQNLVEDLIIEAIQQRGVNVYYIDRQTQENVPLFNEGNKNTFTNSKLIEMQIEEISNFNGEGDLFSAFGGFTLEDSVTFKVSARRFSEEVGVDSEPTPGDIIYLDFAGQAFEVQKKLEDEDYRQWGKNYTYRIKCTKFVYEGEEMLTDIPTLDTLDDLLHSVDELDPSVEQIEDPLDKRDELIDNGISDSILDFGD